MNGLILFLVSLIAWVGHGITYSGPQVAEKAFAPSDSLAYPQNYFSSPLDLPLTLAGNFGEPRKGHFHTGLDFRTNSEEGHVVMAAASGYVSRINVSASGYGNALYITHPNGYVTVYGHLREFVPKLMERLRKEQYAKKAFAVDIELKPNDYPVKQGDTIAFSGSTGASGGPHLHFEIRDSSERPINPLLFGFKITDDKHTVVRALKIYAMDALKFRSRGLTVKLEGKDSAYSVANDVVVVNASKAAISVNAYDVMNLTDNYVGVYHIRLFNDGQLIYEYEMNRISFNESRYVLSHIDYPEFLDDGFKVFHKCFVEPGNKCPVYSHLVNKGIIDLSDGIIHDIKIEVSDYAGNVSTIRFRLFYDAKSTVFKPEELKYAAVFYYNRENEFTSPDIKIRVPAYGLFDTVYFNYSAALATSAGIYSKVHEVGRNDIQAFHWFDISIKTQRLNPKMRDKAVIVYKDADGTEVSCGGQYDSGFVVSKAREFGTYYVKIDTTPPSIVPLNFMPGKNIKNGQKLIFKISDDLSGIEAFATYLDGAWVETDYDAKSYSLIYTPEKDLSTGEHSFKVLVRDERNNSSTYTASFKK